MTAAMLSRDAARELNLRHYYTGRPCKAGHTAPRYVKTANCVECARLRVAQNHAANRDALNLANAQYRAANRVAIAKRMREYQIINREALAAKQVARRAGMREQIAAYNRAYQKANPDVFVRKAARRRAAEIERLPKWYGEFDEFVFEEAARLSNLRRAALGVDWQVDHLIPLRATVASGLHCGTNVQVIPRSLNAKKRNKLWLTEPGEWLKYV